MNRGDPFLDGTNASTVHLFSSDEIDIDIHAKCIFICPCAKLIHIIFFYFHVDQ